MDFDRLIQSFRIGSSRVHFLFSINEGSPYKLYLKYLDDKNRLEDGIAFDERVINDFQKSGIEMEKHILAYNEKMLGKPHLPAGRFFLKDSEKLVIAIPDAIIEEEGKQIPVEAKHTNISEIPLHHILQMHVEMMCMEADYCYYIACLVDPETELPSNKPLMAKVYKNEKLCEKIWNATKTFFVDFIFSEGEKEDKQIASYSTYEDAPKIEYIF